MSYCLYLRKSRADLDAEARGEGETLARHEHTLLELARKQNLNVTKIYSEVVSGETISARPVMQALLHDVEQGQWQGVLVMEVERLARGETIDQGLIAQTFKYSETKIITPLKTYDPNNEFDEEYFEFGLFMSRREYKTINRRMQLGREASVKEGKYIGSCPPYGYIRKKLEHEKGYTLEPHLEESEIVRLIYQWYTQGVEQPNGAIKRIGVSLICRKLNELKVRPRKSDAWVPATIRDILINPIYNGKIRWNWRPAKKKIVDGKRAKERPRTSLENCLLVDGLHEAIIDDITWGQAQANMKINPPRPAPSQLQLKNPLTGIVYCGKCGRSMVRRPYTNRKQHPTLMCPVASCDNVSTALPHVEERIIDALGIWLKEYKVKIGANKKSKRTENVVDLKSRALQKMDIDIKNVNIQKNNLHDLLEQGVYSSDMFLARMHVLDNRIKALADDRQILLNEIDNDKKRNEARVTIIPKIENVIDLYYKTDNPQIKNDLLKEVLEKVYYVKEPNARWNRNPYDFTLDLVPRLPQ